MKESNPKEQVNISVLSGVHQEFDDLINVHISPLVYFVTWGHLREQLNRRLRSLIYSPVQGNIR